MITTYKKLFSPTDQLQQARPPIQNVLYTEYCNWQCTHLSIFIPIPTYLERSKLESKNNNEFRPQCFSSSWARSAFKPTVTVRGSSTRPADTIALLNN